VSPVAFAAYAEGPQYGHSSEVRDVPIPDVSVTSTLRRRHTLTVNQLRIDPTLVDGCLRHLSLEPALDSASILPRREETGLLILSGTL
jgi:hypothetical protein